VDGGQRCFSRDNSAFTRLRPHAAYYRYGERGLRLTGFHVNVVNGFLA
jgi:hypothetical protein